jgi:solute carrier family 25 (mitochondrial folate transporter), member 32
VNFVKTTLRKGNISNKISAKMQWDNNLMAGALAGLVSTVGLYPLELLKIRMQVTDGTSGAYRSLRGAFRSVLQNEGIKGLYKGMTPGVIASTGSWGGYFYFYELSKRRKLGEKKDMEIKTLGLTDHMLSGVEAGSVMVLIFNPMWLIKTRMALQDAKGLHNDQSSKKYKGIYDAVRTIVREEGPKGLYKGLIPALILTSHGAVQFSVYEYMKTEANKYFGNAQGQPAWVSILLGGVSKIAATAITYPYQVIKSRLQQRGNLTAYRYMGVLHCIRRTAIEEGLRGFFRGLVPSALRVAPASALTFVVYEETLKILRI